MKDPRIQLVLGVIYGLIVAYLLYRFIVHNMKKSENETVNQGSFRTVVGFLLRYVIIGVSLLIASLFGRYFLIGSIVCVSYQWMLIWKQRKSS
ncbi:MAG: hypothetical protein PHD56_12190 [Anaerostipes sp.]|nr:hypothetical protein [Anaerostipes sp.]